MDNKMMRLLFPIIFFVTAGVGAQVVNRVRLLDHVTYYQRLINEVMHELERQEWCNLKLPDMTQTLNDTIYGWHIQGTVSYKNGFLYSIQFMDLVQSSIQQTWTHANSITTVALNGNLRWTDMAVAFDVEVALDGQPLQHFTGIYTHELVQFSTSLRKNIAEGTLTALSSLTSLSVGNVRQMVFLPANNLTQVLQRHYRPSDVWDGVNAWATRMFAPIILDKATNVVQYPTLCYNCAA